jgi:hypothetical protein
MILLCTDSLLYTTNPLQIARQNHQPEKKTIKEADEQKFITAPSEQSGPSNPLQIARPSHQPERIKFEEAGQQKFITAPSSEQIISDTLEVN